jgi:hypothetical protein
VLPEIYIYIFSNYLGCFSLGLISFTVMQNNGSSFLSSFMQNVIHIPPIMQTIISSRYSVELYWVPGPAGAQGNEMADKLARDGSVQKFVGREPSLGPSRQYTRIRIKRWLDNQCLERWRGLGGTQRRLEN